MSKYIKAIFLSDIHIPFEDKKSLKITNKFMEWFEPDNIFLLGDIMDFYQVSVYNKDPARILKLQKDLDATKQYLTGLTNDNPNAHIVYIEGNHEARIQSYLWKHPELSSLDALTVPSMLSLEHYDIDYYSANEIYMFNGFLVEHGSMVRKHSGYTARGQMEKRGISGISGHSHRLSTHYLTNMAGDHVWLENGCLCNKTPEYIQGVPNWQHGFSIGWFKLGSKRFIMEQIVITHNKAVYSGQEFK